MNILDILIAIPLGILIFIGWKRGLVREAAALAGVLIGIWASVHFSRLLALMLGLRGENAILIAFFIIFLGTLVLAYLLGRTAEHVIKALKMNIPNKIAGATLGLLKAVCIISVIMSGIAIIDRDKVLITQENRDNSMLYSPVCSTGDELISSLKEYIEEHPVLTETLSETSNKTKEKVNEEISKKESQIIDKAFDKKGGRK